MRKILCDTLVEFSADPDFVFLTGDLGYMALEPLREAMGPRFINAGVAEQNMVSVTAGLALTGFRPWAYSIAPFIYGRPFEQIRNDICMHDLPVVLVGNGGGYAYGVMGATHHAIEDYGVLLCLPNMHVFVPAFATDVPVIIRNLFNFKKPAYLRLGKCERPKEFMVPAYAPWRRLVKGSGPTLLVVGPLVGGILEAIQNFKGDGLPDLWVLTELPIQFERIPKAFMNSMRQSGHLFVVEEHIAQGGVGQILARWLLSNGEKSVKLTHRCAMGYVSGLYGSQNFHRKESGLDPESIMAALKG